MAAINDLSAELLLIVASYLSQVDLLNISITCKQLRYVTEPELYREYYNARLDRRHVKPYVLRLISRPDLWKYVRSLAIESRSCDRGERFFSKAKEEYLFPGTGPLTRDQYEVVTDAAVRAGLILRALAWDAVVDLPARVRDLEYLRPDPPQVSDATNTEEYIAAGAEDADEFDALNADGTNPADMGYLTISDPEHSDDAEVVNPVLEDARNYSETPAEHVNDTDMESYTAASPENLDATDTQDAEGADAHPEDHGSGESADGNTIDASGAGENRRSLKRDEILSEDDDDKATDAGGADTSDVDMLGWSDEVHEQAFRHLPYDTLYCKALCAGFKDPWIVVLLTLIPNLRDLDVLEAPLITSTFRSALIPNSFPN